MKTILGLDIGSNSIGWSIIDHDVEEHTGKILGMGSRIIPMEGREKDFEAGKSISKAADRRMARGARRLLQRYKIRRERLILALKEIGAFPNDFPEKFDYRGNTNINEIVPFDENSITEAKKYFSNEKIPIDWVLYYLKAKATREKISLHEFGRILYHYNQRRGFKSSRKDKSLNNEENKIKYPIRDKYISIVEILEIEEDEILKRNIRYNMQVKTNEGELIEGSYGAKEKPDWIGKNIELEITRIENKAGDIKYEFRIPNRTDWQKRKIALEKDILESGLYVSEYFLQNIKNDPNYRIKDRIIDRSFYQKEFDAIWEVQKKYHPELNDQKIKERIGRNLYEHNEAKFKEALGKDLHSLIRNDIIYYQRELKSQKHLISECPYEKKDYVDKNGIRRGYKVCPKSSPFFQEYRIWQTISNLRVIELTKHVDGKIKTNVDITNDVLTTEIKEKIFELFDYRATVSQSAILKLISQFKPEISEKRHKLNFMDKEFKGNETKAKLISIFKKHNYLEQGLEVLNSPDNFYKLWHIIYSLNYESHIISALSKNFNFPPEVIKELSLLPEYPKQYAAYSSKAIKKLLSLMRAGKYWNKEDIPSEAIDRINRILSGERIFDAKNVNEEFDKLNLKSLKDFSSLPVYLACYLVYGRFTEPEKNDKFNSCDEIKPLPPNSLRNPIVEQVVNETLNLVKDIWKTFGRPDEIHVELARELKQNNEERQRTSSSMKKNEEDRKRIISILRELDNANPASQSDIEKLRLWEELGNDSAGENFPKISKTPTSAEIEKYKLWGEQNHLSPYTRKIIPLSKLFTSEYQIEHIIPKSRFFDNSFANKTICEASVNAFKDKTTAMELINKHGGREIEFKGKKFTLLSPDEYIRHINRTFKGRKRRNFLSESIPQDFIARQLNDTRYINKKLSELLKPIANENVVFTVGSITNELKEKWGLKSIWKEIIRPRFERLEDITGERWIEITNDNKIIYKKDYKRIDHRHHALDALVVACTSISHIQYLNTLNSYDNSDRFKKKYWYLTRAGVREFVLPWQGFPKEAKDKLNEIIISHKNRNRVLTKGFNLYTKWVLEEGKWKKKLLKQDKGKLISIRKSLFKEPFGKVYLANKKSVNTKKAIEYQYEYLTNFKSKKQPRIFDRDLRKHVNELISNCNYDLSTTLNFIKQNKEWRKIKKIDILQFVEYAAKRVSLDDSFTLDKINKIPYSNYEKNYLVKTLKEHLSNYNNNPKEAFSLEGLEVLKSTFGKQINKVTIIEPIGKKRELKGKLVEGDKGSNMFFVIHVNKEDPFDRKIFDNSSVALIDAIDKIINKEPFVEVIEGYYQMVLSPNDLVYVAEEGEIVSNEIFLDKKNIFPKIYKVVSFTGRRLYCIPHFVAAPIVSPQEFGSNNKVEKDWNGKSIKHYCFKIKIDRLGNITLDRK